jgi:DNA-binding winged helix-turn-helix (wHTH) protein
MIDTQQTFYIADIAVFPTTDQLSYEGKTIEIKSMTMRLICFFANHQHEVVTRKDLRESIWVNANASDHTINNHMYTLRQTFANLDNDNKYFHTVTGSKGGYRLLAKVSQPANDFIVQPIEEIPRCSDPTHFINKQEYPQTQLGSLAVITQYKLYVIIGFLILLLFGLYLFTESKLRVDTISPLTSMAGREQNPTISQDGSIILYANRVNRNSSWEIYASKLSDSSQIVETKKVFSALFRQENYVSISPNNKQIAFIRYPIKERGIYLADFDEKTLTATNTRLIIPLETMNLSPTISWLNDTEFFYTATKAISAPRKIYKYDLKADRSEPISAPPLNTYGDFAAIVSPNKKWLAIMRADEALGYQLFLYDLQTKILFPTLVTNNKNRRNVSFSDDSRSVYFIDQDGYLSEYLVNAKNINIVSLLPNVGYWPLKIPGKQRFITQQDWGLSSSTNRVIQISNPLTGGDGSRKKIIDNKLSTRSITSIDNGGLIFASVAANQDIELWKYQNGQSMKLNAFNSLAHQQTYLSLDWLKGTNKALLSIDNSCHLIDINTGKDSPLCPANEALYAGRFSKDGQSIFLASGSTSNAIKMDVSGYPLTIIPPLSDINSLHEGEDGDFFYSHEPSFDIYHFNATKGESKKIIDRTYIIERFSNNDFVVMKSGIYFMDRKAVRENAIYYYDFKSKNISYVVASKDNYPHVVISDDEKFIYLIESYDDDSQLLLLNVGS